MSELRLFILCILYVLLIVPVFLTNKIVLKKGKEIMFIVNLLALSLLILNIVLFFACSISFRGSEIDFYLFYVYVASAILLFSFYRKVLAKWLKIATFIWVIYPAFAIGLVVLKVKSVWLFPFICYSTITPVISENSDSYITKPILPMASIGMLSYAEYSCILFEKHYLAQLNDDIIDSIKVKDIKNYKVLNKEQEKMIVLEFNNSDIVDTCIVRENW